MKFPFREVHGFEDTTRNFEFMEQSGIYWGTGAPAFVPQENQQGHCAFFFRRDTPGTANQRIYVWNGTTWTGIL